MVERVRAGALRPRSRASPASDTRGGCRSPASSGSRTFGSWPGQSHLNGTGRPRRPKPSAGRHERPSSRLVRPLSALRTRKSTSANGSSAITTRRESPMRLPWAAGGRALTAGSAWTTIRPPTREAEHGRRFPRRHRRRARGRRRLAGLMIRTMARIDRRIDNGKAGADADRRTFQAAMHAFPSERRAFEREARRLAERRPRVEGRLDERGLAADRRRGEPRRSGPTLPTRAPPSSAGRRSGPPPAPGFGGMYAVPGAGGGTRTPTGLPLTDFESVVSTDSTTPAKAGF